MKFDCIIIGSGFGGSVSALRLAEKGYSVAVLEKGKRWRSQDFPETNWNVRKFLWAPLLRCFGIQKITLFRNIFVLSGVGVGGGSLVYANTLVKPKSAFFKDPAWSGIDDWENRLAPHYETARRMLGASQNKFFGTSDEVLKQIGRDLGCEDTFSPVDVAVYFGEPGKETKDPYFGGKGPDRAGCTYCGGCMVGCRYNAKNTLDKNYLYLAEKSGAQIFSETEVFRVTPQSDGSYAIETKSPTAWFLKKRKIFYARKVIFSGGVMGSVKLLLENKYKHKTLPKISNQLGRTIRTNGESLVGATATHGQLEFSKGLAITSSIQPDAITKIESVRYSKGSDFMRLLTAPFVGPGSNLMRPLKTLALIVLSWKKMLKLWIHKDWANSTIILLIMQSVDNQISLGLPRKWYRLFRKSFGAIDTNKNKIDSYIPISEKAVLSASRNIDGIPQMAFSEAFLNAPATAHILGGAKIGSTEHNGVIDKQGQVFNYPGLYIVDGSIIPANLGVNPSLTITALAEHLMSMIPDKA